MNSNEFTSKHYTVNLTKLKQKINIDALNGWKRCKEHGIFKHSHIYANKLPDLEFKKVLLENEDFIKKSIPFMQRLFSIVKKMDFAILLTDFNGYILEIMGKRELLNKLGKVLHVERGTICDEKVLGNTAITSSLIEKKSVQLSGKEHYLGQWHQFATAAAPIMYDNELIGSLGIIGYDGMMHLHTLGMVMAFSKAIESYIELHKTNFQLLIKSKYQNAIMEYVSDGFLTIDNKGRLTYINTVGAEILEIDKKNSIGKDIRELVDFNPVILNVLKTGKGYQDREFIVRDRSGVKHHFIKSAKVIRDSEGNIVGVLDNFKKDKECTYNGQKIVGAHAKFNFNDIIGKNKKMQESIRLAKVAAGSSSNVLVYGESGTGKELVVQSIHNASIRRGESFISINCAAIPGELIESELFGYEGGAFTGAQSKGQTGKFELANGGTIFLDEIGDLPLHLQGKLLRVIQEKQLTRVGGSDIIDIDVRIISATNKNLLLESKRAIFREDLYYRLNVLSIYIPPLRERRDDIEELAYHFIEKVSGQMGKDVKGISKEALQVLKDYFWPGNIRELENTIERAVNICMCDMIDLEHINKDVIIGNSSYNKLIKDGDIIINESLQPAEIKSLDEVEKEAIIKALEVTNGNITRASEKLNISRNTLYNKIEKYKIKRC